MVRHGYVIPGKVYLIGAGPGDPELLTLKAARLLRVADAILHDDLVSDEILALAPPGARVQNVGKRCGKDSISQPEIERRLIEYAQQGLTVVRLKGGDPLVFGRAGEEMDALARAGVEFEVVPGVTAVLGAAAAAQVALTDRRLASKLLLVSNHHSRDKADSAWVQMADEDTTLAVYMPGQNVAARVEELVRGGLSSDTPCAVISCATRREQKVVRMTLGEVALAPTLGAPALLVIGAVAAERAMAARDWSVEKVAAKAKSEATAEIAQAAAGAFEVRAELQFAEEISAEVAGDVAEETAEAPFDADAAERNISLSES
ncbi:MAG: uroporphyrinogen-III C-methyltransferase [Candidatus Acidiferrales bacterium]|jgi:uroporphyrin-III C-methyltransferase